MYLYLVRHGEAKSEREDPARPLSEAGMNEVRKVASFMSVPDIARIYHSPRLRAAQTAEVFAVHVKPSGGFSEAEGLGPGDPPGIWANRIDTETGNTMLVGHLPHMARLASLLLTGDDERAAFDFAAASVLCMRRMEGNWWVRWMLRPEMLP